VLLAFQTGDDVRVLKDITFHRRSPEAVTALLADAGLDLVLRVVREPVELPSQVEQVPQAYLVARRPSEDGAQPA
jgi:hypothetical protein